MMRWMWYNGWQSGWVGLLMGLMMLLFWGAVIAIIYYALRSLLRGGGIIQQARTPLEILKERYAKGEVADADYDRMRQKLEEKQ
jgi:putative membrane protein